MAYTPPTPYAGLTGNVNFNSGLQLVDEVLTNVAKLWKPEGFVYDRLVTPISVNYNMGQYPVFEPGAFFNNGGNLAVADDAPTPHIDFKWSHDVYHCIDYRLQAKITRKEMLQANPALRLDYVKTLGLMTVFAQNREARLAAKLNSNAVTDPLTGIVGQFTNANQSAPSVKWDAGVSGTEATIQKDLQAAALVVYKQCGKFPNTLVIDKQVAIAIASDYSVREIIKYLMGPDIFKQGAGANEVGAPGILPPTLWGYNVEVSDGDLINNARPGQTSSLTGIWGNNARLIYRPANGGWGTPSTVYAFRGRVTEGSTQPPASVMPSGDGGAEPGGTGGWAIVDRWWDYDPPGEHIRCWECVDERVVAPETGILIPNVLTSY